MCKPKGLDSRPKGIYEGIGASSEPRLHRELTARQGLLPVNHSSLVMRFLLFLFGALVCIGLPIYLFKLGSPPATDAQRWSEAEIEQLDSQHSSTEEPQIWPDEER